MERHHEQHKNRQELVQLEHPRAPQYVHRKRANRLARPNAPDAKSSQNATNPDDRPRYHHMMRGQVVVRRKREQRDPHSLRALRCGRRRRRRFLRLRRRRWRRGRGRCLRRRRRRLTWCRWLRTRHCGLRTSGRRCYRRLGRCGGHRGRNVSAAPGRRADDGRRFPRRHGPCDDDDLSHFRRRRGGRLARGIDRSKILQCSRHSASSTGGEAVALGSGHASVIQPASVAVSASKTETPFAFQYFESSCTQPSAQSPSLTSISLATHPLLSNSACTFARVPRSRRSRSSVTRTSSLLPSCANVTTLPLIAVTVPVELVLVERPALLRRRRGHRGAGQRLVPAEAPPVATWRWERLRRFRSRGGGGRPGAVGCAAGGACPAGGADGDDGAVTYRTVGGHGRLVDVDVLGDVQAPARRNPGRRGVLHALAISSGDGSAAAATSWSVPPRLRNSPIARACQDEGERDNRCECKRGG